MVGFEKESERLRKMMEIFGYVWVGSRYSAGCVELRVTRIWIRKLFACRGDMVEPRSLVFLLSNLFFTFFFPLFFLFFYFLYHTLYSNGLLASFNASVTCKNKTRK